MVGNEDIRLFWVEVLAAFHLAGTESKGSCHTSPDNARIVTPEVTVAESAAKHGGHSSKNCHDDEQRHEDEPLIEKVQNKHVF